MKYFSVPVLIVSFPTTLDFSPTSIAYIFLAGSTADLDSTTILWSQSSLGNPNQADQGARHLASNPGGMNFVKGIYCCYELTNNVIGNFRVLAVQWLGRGK